MAAIDVLAVLLAIGAVIAMVIAIRRDRSLRQTHARLERLRTEEEERARRAGSRSLDEEALREALDAGVIRVDAGLRVREANRRAHAVLGRAVHI